MAKLLRPAETAAGFASLGLPGSAVTAMAVAGFEPALAVLLVVAPRSGGVVALAALGGFSAVLVGVLRDGRRATCRCFGAITAGRVSRAELVRNGALALLAVVALAWGG
jgi:Methylamine utilisation protein MauE